MCYRFPGKEPMGIPSRIPPPQGGVRHKRDDQNLRRLTGLKMNFHSQNKGKGQRECSVEPIFKIAVPQASWK